MPPVTRVLVVDVEVGRARALVELLAPAGFDTSHVQPAHLPFDPVDVVLLSLDTMDASAVTRCAAALPDASIMLLVSARDQPRAHEALLMGACDVVDRAAGGEILLWAIERAAREARQRCDLAALRSRLGEEARQTLVGSSPGVCLVRELLGRAAASRRIVLVMGEAGTGKSTVARMIHDLSERAARPFVIARCEGADADALERELFGGDRGGLLETARGGTLVLDEARALPRPLYARLAAMLAERIVRRAGAPADAHAVDIRLVLTARTSADEPSLDAGSLLGDRNVLPIVLPPLRERRRDIPVLVQHFRARIAHGRGAPLSLVGPATMTPLLAHHWPGNVRELEHWVERIALADADGTTFRGAVVAPGADFAQFDAARLTLGALERKFILHVLAQEGGHQSRAADRLGIDRRTLYRKLREYRADLGTTQKLG